MKVNKSIDSKLESTTEAEPSYSFKDEQEKLYNGFKEELCKRMQPVVESLVSYLRHLELEEAGKGVSELDGMLDSGDINKPMHEILKPALENLDKDYVINLSTSKYFNNGKSN